MQQRTKWQEAPHPAIAPSILPDSSLTHLGVQACTCSLSSPPPLSSSCSARASSAPRPFPTAGNGAVPPSEAMDPQLPGTRGEASKEEREWHLEGQPKRPTLRWVAGLGPSPSKHHLQPVLLPSVSLTAWEAALLGRKTHSS